MPVRIATGAYIGSTEGFAIGRRSRDNFPRNIGMHFSYHIKAMNLFPAVSPIIREPVAMTSETSQLPNPTVETSQDNQGILVSSPLPSSSSGQNLMTDYIRNTKPLPHQKLKNG
ncbi:hypothetical protein EVAR_85178_1 [Eumeta japonica]|uniref:Uncharacterized protein n=1 Tax=Eumeta variegata TaxID=151549 RepID=A0A4C1W1I3_EUMVA|nr:hypothetical protein EVAR_85178_1 [Eumeta japonica]